MDPFWSEVAKIFNADPFNWKDCGFIYPDAFYVAFYNGDGTRRLYVTGMANATFTVDFYPEEKYLEGGEHPLECGDTGLPVIHHADGNDPFEVAVCLAATIIKMETL